MVKVKTLLVYVTSGNKTTKIIEISNIIKCDMCGEEMRYTIDCPTICSKCLTHMTVDDAIFRNVEERLNYHDNYGFGSNENIPGYFYL